MTSANYAFQGYDDNTMSRVYGRSLPISTKRSVEVCKMIRGMSVVRAKALLKDVASLKKAVPYRRFNQELAHQKNTGSGGFPVAVSEAIIKLLASVQANASAKGLNQDSLKIVHSCAHLASRPMRYGRKRRVKAKRTHVEIVVQEMEKPKKKSSEKKLAPKSGSKTEKSAQKKESDAKSVTPAKTAEQAKVDSQTEKPVATDASKNTEGSAVEGSQESANDDENKDKKDDAQ